MSTANAIHASWTPATSPTHERDIESILTDLGVGPVAAHSGEKRGIPAETWQFLLEVDWSVVRDTIIANVLASGVTGTLTGAAAFLASRFSKIPERMPFGPRNGTIVIRDTRRGVIFEIPGDAAGDPQIWLSALQLGDKVPPESRTDEIKSWRNSQ
jgi:hypothetical protein